MKVQFSKIEKIAGVFVLCAGLISVFSFIGLAVKKGWLTSTVSFHTYLPSAEGVSSGTVVQMSGLKVGSVTSTKLVSQEKIKVDFEVYSEFSEIGDGSQVMVFRPFLIGEKVLDIQMGESSDVKLQAGAEIPYTPSTDIMDILSGKKMGMALNSFDQVAQSLKILGEAFSDGKRAKEFVKMIDQLEPLVKNMNTMSLEMTKMTSIALKEKRMEQMMDKMPELVDNLNVLTSEFKKITPAISAIAPELPRTSLRAVEALDEAVIVLKAMQKSFFLRGNVEKVLAEEKEESLIRTPANDQKSPK